MNSVGRQALTGLFLQLTNSQPTNRSAHPENFMKLFYVTIFSLISSFSYAARGDAYLPQTISASEAQTYIDSYKQVSAVHGCPDNQSATSGTVSGVGSLAGGSHTITISLSGGATF